jgi:hypothetical protein
MFPARDKRVVSFLALTVAAQRGSYARFLKHNLFGKSILTLKKDFKKCFCEKAFLLKWSLHAVT